MKIYEVDFHIIPEEKEADSVFKTIQGLVSEYGGNIISTLPPENFQLAYTILYKKTSATKYERYNDSYFTSIKFEMSPENISKLEESLKADDQVIRHLITETVRENTRVDEADLLDEEEVVEEKEGSGEAEIKEPTTIES